MIFLPILSFSNIQYNIVLWCLRNINIIKFSASTKRVSIVRLQVWKMKLNEMEDLQYYHTNIVK